MNKLFKLTQAKGKWHKFFSFNLAGGAKLYKNFAQKLLAVSLCMAVVLLGVPRGQNFVAEAAEEATKSVALLTLTLTGKGADAEEAPGEGSDAEEVPGESTEEAPVVPLAVKQVPTVPVPAVPVAASVEAAMKWKSFVPGTPVGLEVVFVDQAGTASEPLDYGSWLDTYGSMASYDVGFKTFAPADWLAALPSDSPIPTLFGAAWEPIFFPLLRSFLGTRDWLAPLPFLSGAGDPADPFGFVGSPGLARVPLGSSLSVLPHPFFPALFFAQDGGLPPDVTVSTAFSVAAAAADASVVSFDSSSASIFGVGVGVTTLSLSATVTATPPSGGSVTLGPAAFGSLAVEVYAPTVPVSGVSLSETTKSLTVGESFALTALVSPEDATNNTVIWESSDPSVADVSSDGVVTAMGPGTATLTVETEDGDFTAECTVTVTEAAGTPDTPDSTPDSGRCGAVWGTADLTVFDTFPQYVNEAGRTSRVLESGALDGRGILWLKETSDNTSAWYGLDLSTGAFELDGQTAFYVQWLSPNDAGYAEVYAQLDAAQKSRVEADNGWIFLIGVEDLDGNTIQPAHPVNVYVQIGDDWDADDLNAYYIAAGGDENVPVDYLMLDYPAGTDTFGRMTLEHFSPYIIFDELTDEEQATLGKGNPTTGDHAAQMAISGLGMVLVLALGIMLRLITGKKKFED